MGLADEPGSWPVVSSTYLHRDAWVVALRKDTIHAPADPGTTFGRLVVEHPGAAFALAVDEDDRVCLLRQYRHPAGGTFVEIPAGICDVEGEDPLETARRELQEEAELAAEEWTHLLSTYPSAGLTSERHHFYLARGLRPAPRPEAFEVAHEEAHMEVFWAPLEELVDAVLDGRVQEGPMAIALLAYQALRIRSLRG